METGINGGFFEAELAVGTNVVQGTVYIENPGWIAFKKVGGGVDLNTGIDRYLVAFEEDVKKEGGYERYGKKWLGRDYEFGGVKMQAFNKWILYANWRALYHDPNTPNDPEWLMRRLEEFP